MTDDFVKTLEDMRDKQSSQVAELILTLLDRPYSVDEQGYKQAISDAMEGYDKIALTKAVPPATLDPSRIRMESVAPPLTGPLPPPTHYSKALEQAGTIAQFWPGKFLGVKNKPGPLASAAVLGLLGAGGGYTLGKLRTLLGHKDYSGRTAIAGGLLGTIPGALWGMNKKSYEFNIGSQIIPVEQIEQLAWDDPFVSTRLQPGIAAGLTAAVESARRIGKPRNPSSVITAADLGRIAVGAGGGYAGGYAAGKAIGAVFGISQKSQDVMKYTGMTAGILNKFVPMIYGNN